MITTRRMKAAQSAAINALALIDYAEDCEAARVAIANGVVITTAPELKSALENKGRRG